MATEAKATQDHVLRLGRLKPNTEYVYQVESATKDSFADASSSRFSSFTTKTSLPSLVIRSPAEGETVKGTLSVKVEAFDSVHRFSDNGISTVELYAGDLTVKPSSYDPKTRQYTFTLDTTQLPEGYIGINALATDDFWNTVSYVRTMRVRNSTAATRPAPAGVDKQPTGR